MSWLIGIRARGRPPAEGADERTAALASAAASGSASGMVRDVGEARRARASSAAEFRAGYLATLLITSVSLPVVGAALTVALYIGGQAAPPLGQRWADLALGAAGAAALWLLIAGCAVPYATARRANAASFGDFSLEFEELEARLAAAPASTGKHTAETLAARLRAATQDDRRELRWLSGTGYVELWATLHRAQEALLLVEPVPAVLERAHQYERRLHDSTIANAGALLATLRRAAAALDPAAATYLAEPTDAGGTVLAPLVAQPAPAPAQGQDGQAAGAPGQAGDATPAPAPAPPVPAPATLATAEAASARPETRGDHLLARAAIRQVVRDVNDFRDRRRAGIVRVRNQLLRTVSFAGLLIYVLTALAVIVGVLPSALTAAAAVYLVGSTVGLFNRLYLDSQADTASEEDFGLSVARLLHTPLFSGLAAIGGVVVTALLPLSVATAGPNPPAAAPTSPPLAAVASQPRPTLEQIFDLSGYPSGLLVAAVFGLTPSLLIGRLSQPIEQYKKDLRSTETQQGK